MKFCYIIFCCFEFFAKENEFVAKKFYCFECVEAIFFVGCRIFVLFWNVKLQQYFLHFCGKKDFVAKFCVVLKYVVLKFVVSRVCCNNHFAIQEKRNLFQIFVVVWNVLQQSLEAQDKK
jgi:hypothetical protein